MLAKRVPLLFRSHSATLGLSYGCCSPLSKTAALAGFFAAESLVCLASSKQGRLGAALEVVAEQNLSLFLVCMCWKANLNMHAGVVPATPTHNAFRQIGQEKQAEATALHSVLVSVLCHGLYLGAFFLVFQKSVQVNPRVFHLQCQHHEQLGPQPQLP